MSETEKLETVVSLETKVVAATLYQNISMPFSTLYIETEFMLTGTCNVQTFHFRLNFTLSDIDVACPAHKHFERCVAKLIAKYEIKHIDLDQSLPQYFQYTRSKHLVGTVILVLVTKGQFITVLAFLVSETHI